MSDLQSKMCGLGYFDLKFLGIIFFFRLASVLDFSFFCLGCTVINACIQKEGRKVLRTSERVCIQVAELLGEEKWCLACGQAGTLVLLVQKLL